MKKKILSAQVQFEIDKIKRKSFTRTIICSVSFLILGGIIGGTVIHNKYKQFDDPNVQKFVDAYNIMVDEWLYGEQDNQDQLIDTAIKSLTNNEDPYTFYTTKNENQNLSTTQNGLGFRYSYYGGNYLITYVYEDSDAYNQGLSEGDVVVASKIDGEWITLKDKTYEESKKAMLGENDVVMYRLIDKNNIEKEISFKRSEYKYKSAEIINSYLTEKNELNVTIKIDTFLSLNLKQYTEDILDDCLENYSKTDINQLTIDLRGNGGGYVSSAVELTSLFVKKGSIVLSYRYKDGSMDHFETKTNKKFNVNKFCILQDANTASASETFIMALKDLAEDNNFEVEVIGTTSYGKGIVQEVKYYSDGSALRCTIAETVSPNGVCIHKIGIKPDVDLSAAYYYFGEWGTMNEESKEKVIFCINFVLEEEYDSFEEAIKAFQNENGLETSGELNIETSQLLQKLSYDKYVSIVDTYIY